MKLSEFIKQLNDTIVIAISEVHKHSFIKAYKNRLLKMIKGGELEDYEIDWIIKSDKELEVVIKWKINYITR